MYLLVFRVQYVRVCLTDICNHKQPELSTAMMCKRSTPVYANYKCHTLWQYQIHNHTTKSHLAKPRGSIDQTRTINQSYWYISFPINNTCLIFRTPARIRVETITKYRGVIFFNLIFILTSSDWYILPNLVAVFARICMQVSSYADKIQATWCIFSPACRNVRDQDDFNAF